LEVISSHFLFEQTEMNLDTGEPLEELAPVTKQWCKRLGCEANTVKDVLTGPNEQVVQKCYNLPAEIYQI
jgi:hypothetical protein